MERGWLRVRKNNLKRAISKSLNNNSSIIVNKLNRYTVIIIR